MSQKNELKSFGWYGLSGMVPADWDLTSVSALKHSGYFAFDDERFRRLEIKYNLGKRFGKPDLKKTLEYYFKSIRKRLKNVPFEVDWDVRFVGLDDLPEERQYLTYGWTSDAVARGMIWYCPTCRRITIAQCMSPPNRANLREMSEILMSLRCHPEGETTKWAAFDFEFDAPKRLALITSKLQAGLISLTLAYKGERLVVDRLGMAQSVVEHTPLDEYVEKIHYKKLRGRRMRFHEEELAGNPGFRIEGERRRLFHFIPIIGPWLRDALSGDHVDGHAWVSPLSNRLYIVRAEGKNARVVADQVAESIASFDHAPDTGE
jgi:hypothetical protein